MFVSRWTVDYGDGPHSVVVPHAWAQEVSVEWEGPAIYRTEIDVPRGGGTLRFHGVSYAAEISANGSFILKHEGLWDAFDVPLPGGKAALEVRVLKHGGLTYPVETVAGGGLPNLFHTFGGLYREVELLEPGSLPLVRPAPEDRPPVPYVRGVVHRGWYPDLGHPNPDEAIVRREIREIKALGFNLVKFAGWVPPHRYLDLLEEAGMLGWIELPEGATILGSWHDPRIDEIERIVRQYRHHPNIVVWTLHETPATAYREHRRELADWVRALTGAPLVTDGPHETTEDVGNFDEVAGSPHPGLHEAFDALHPGSRGPRPILYGSFARSDAHRDLARLGDELPFWASALPELGGPTGRRLAGILEENRFANEPTRSGHKPLLASSRSNEAFLRKTRVEAIRARAGHLRGYAIAELRDTPVSSSGLLDDWGAPRITPEDCAAWNGPACLFPLLRRLVQGGSAEIDPFAHFAGEARLTLGLHTETPQIGRLWWRIVDAEGRTAARGTGPECEVEGASAVGEVVWADAKPGDYRLMAGFGDAENAWDFWVVERPEWHRCAGWRREGAEIKELNLPGGECVVAFHRPVESPRGVLILDAGDGGTHEASMGTDCALEFRDEAFWNAVPLKERWARLLAVAACATLDPAWLRDRFGTYEVLLNRIDTSAEGRGAEAPILVRAGGWLVTTLRPEGAAGLRWNPAGCAFLKSLMHAAPDMTTSAE